MVLAAELLSAVAVFAATAADVVIAVVAGEAAGAAVSVVASAAVARAAGVEAAEASAEAVQAAGSQRPNIIRSASLSCSRWICS